MTSISKFDSQIYSEEIAPVTSEREYDEVMSLMAEDESGWQGYRRLEPSRMKNRHGTALKSLTESSSRNSVSIHTARIHDARDH